MRVQMKTKIGGYRDGVEWPDKGGVIDVPAHEADGLIANGYAVVAPDEIEEDVDADQGSATDGDGDAPADADGDSSGTDDAGAEAPAGDEAAGAEPAAARTRKPAAKRVSAKTQEA